MTAPVIAIDFGTTNSSVAVFQNGMQRRSFTVINVDSTTNSSVAVFQSGMQHWPFTVINVDSTAVEHGATQQTAEEIAVVILTKLKETAERYLRKFVSDAVITVPAMFNRTQRESIMNAAEKARLNVLRIISTSSATALAYTVDKMNSGKEQNLLIFDLGGGTLDVSIVTVSKGFVEVISTGGNTNLGGKNFDNNLVDHCVQKIKSLNNKDLTTNKHALNRLRTACERAKCVLSSQTEATIHIYKLFDGIDFDTSITRRCFESINETLFKSVIDVVKKTLVKARLRRCIHEVILVGGSSQIPRVQTLLQALFHGKKLNKSMNLPNASACGAAVQAAICSRMTSVKGVLLLDAIPFSLGVEIAGGKMQVILEHNTLIPARVTRTFTTCTENQRSILVQIFEGESSDTQNNSFLGKFELLDLTDTPRGDLKIKITLDIDVYSTLRVTATETVTNGTMKTSSLKIGQIFDEKEYERHPIGREFVVWNKQKAGPPQPTVKRFKQEQ